MAKIKKSNIDFLKKLSKNNNRDWFNENKPTYLKEHENLIDFAENVLSEMREHDQIETLNGKKSLHRIYRDVRFSKNKDPYKTNWSGSLKRATQQLRGGYYFHIEPGNSFVGGGFWGPNKDDLLKIRKGMITDEDEFRKILSSKEFTSVFGELYGDQLKTAPKGFDKESSAVDLLRFKQHILKHDFTDEEVLSEDFAKKVSDVFKAMRPFFDLMSYILTTDENGVPLYED